MHSHDYRTPDQYRNRRVLVVGAGPSGMDIGLDVADVASRLIHSHHSRINFTTPFPPHYHKKPDIQEFNETGVIFTDGSYEEIDDVLYCTGSILTFSSNTLKLKKIAIPQRFNLKSFIKTIYFIKKKKNCDPIFS